MWEITTKGAHLVLAVVADALSHQEWIALEEIEERLKIADMTLSPQAVDQALKELVEKECLSERHDDGALLYRIPMGMLRRWIQNIKPVTSVESEFMYGN